MAEFVPRLTSDGMQGSKYWYSNQNPFYPAGYGLPNCTCYAWGRFWEISDVLPHLPTSDAGQWWYDVSNYEVGQTPQLGAVACWDNPAGAGHVAIVEEIHEDGSITLSNSAWQSTYFYLTRGGYPNWGGPSGYIFQGFIYNPEQPIPPTPSNKSKMPLWFYLKLF